MTPTFRTSGNVRHYATPAYKRTSTLGGAFETTRIICRIGLVPAVVITGLVLTPFAILIALFS